MRRPRKPPTTSVVERIRARRKSRANRQLGESPAIGAPTSGAGCSKVGEPKRKPPKPPAPPKGNSPTAWRIAGALGTTPRELAVQLDVPFDEIDEMFKGTSGTSAIAAGHPAWFALGKLVDEQIGLLMGVRAEIEGKCELDAKRLRERIERSKL